VNARDEIAHLLFITDNSSARDVEAEWRAAGGKQLIYIYAMADALIAAGYVKAAGQ
jgi:hypothetical protein